MVPADCVALKTHNQSGQCYIQTDALDGERHLKPRMTLKETNHLESWESMKIYKGIPTESL